MIALQLKKLWSTPQNASQSVSVDMVDSDNESVIASAYDDQHVDGAATDQN